MAEPSILAILGRFAGQATRAEAARDLARRLGVEALIVFVRDPDLGELLPAPGFPQTLRGGAEWRAFLARCSQPGDVHAHVPSPLTGLPTTALARRFDDGTVLTLLGGSLDVDEFNRACEGFGLVGALFRAETAARLAAGETAVARAASRHARGLAQALDAARQDLQRALHEAALLNERLKEADRRKDEFIAMLGHELRNPMAAISGALEVLRQRRDDTSAVDRAHSVLERQAHNLARLLDDLLDLGRITRGHITLRPEPVDVNDVVRCAVEAVRPFVASRGHVLHLRERASTWADADPARLEQIVSNLLANAVKYTDPGGAITIAVELEGTEAVIRVTDTGIGIEPAMLERVFEPFVQVAPTLARTQGGMGIGLTLVKQLAELHDGRVSVSSAFGRGSEFVVRIPARSDPCVRMARPPGQSPRASMRVLVVDDNHDSAEMMAALLSHWGHEVKIAGDGPGALETAARFQPEAVLLDIGLPGLDGYEVAKRLRIMPHTRASRIIAVSGYGTAGDRQESRAAGFDAHILKPVDFGELESLLGLGTS